MYSDPGIQSLANHHVRHISTLRNEGVSRRDVESAIDSGVIVRIRRGWYATPDAHPDLVRAVRVGGVLTGPSAARLYGLWVPPDDRLHVSVPRNASRLRLTTDAAGSPPCLHWRRDPVPSAAPVEHLPAVLRQSVECLREEMAIVLIDSALNLRVGGLAPSDLQAEFHHLGLKYRRVLGRADPRSQSGLETLVRLRLRARGITVRPQIHHPGVGSVDLVVGDRLVIELDGREHHDTDGGFSSDRRRDLILFRDGYERLRLTYRNVIHQWPDVEPIILDSVRRRRHRWRSGDRPGAQETVSVPRPVHVFR